MKLSIDDKKGLYEFIAKNMKPKDVEKKVMGEVFTPLSLFTEMVDKIEEYCGNTFFANPDLKILDPAAGIGNFPIVLYERLMLRLEKEITDKEVRKKHILENILYINELNKKNYRVCKKIFEGDKYKLNIEQKDFLQKDPVFGDLKFDLIIGNPPFSAHKASDSQSASNVIWNKFVIYSLDLLKDDGYLSFIHPPGWRKPDTEESKSKTKGLFDLMTKINTMIYLEMHSQKDGSRVFEAGTKYDWYIIRKGNQDSKLALIDYLKKIPYHINIHKYDWLPNHSLIKVKSLVGNPSCKVLYDRTSYGSDKQWVSSIKDKTYKYPLIHTTPMDGIRYMYSSTNKNGLFGVPKIIFGDSGINNVIVDFDGKYGMTGHSIGIQIKTEIEGNVIKDYLLGKEFQDILEACMWGNYGIDWRLFASFRDKFWEPKSLKGGHNLFLRKVPAASMQSKGLSFKKKSEEWKFCI